MKYHDTVVIGAGLTGLSTAFHLSSRHTDTIVLEKESRIGGQIRTYTENGFTFESGPNTGVVSFPEVAELFQQLKGRCKLEIARESSKRRLIWKGTRFHALPSGLKSAITTPLFTLSDKFRILGEPWRKKGTDPNEPVGALACRRLGKSFYEYAVDPFVSGVYAGDPMKLTTRFALPKLYRLEAEHGSFIRGSIAKAREPKTDRDRLATKKVFSAVGGLQRMIEAMAQDLQIITNAKDIKVMPKGDGLWQVTYNGQEKIECRHVVTTVGAYALPDLLPFIDQERMQKMSNLFYAPIIQVCVGIKDARGLTTPAFGGLVPSKEQKRVLGILFPSECFVGRAPEIALVQKLCTPHNVNAFGMLFAEAIIEKEGMLDELVDKQLKGKQHLIDTLEDKGYIVNAKEGNFIFIKPKNRDASEIVDLMKKDKKILIKVYKDVPDLGDCLRVSIGESEVMDIFIEALEDLDK